MFRLSTLLTSILLTSPLPALCSNLPTVLTPFTLTPSVEIFQSPVSKVETLSFTPRVTKAFSSGGFAVAGASVPSISTTPVVQKIESYSSGDSSNAEIRDLLRSLLSELRNTKPVTTFSTQKSSFGGPAPSNSYDAPSPARLSDSYGPPSPARLSDSYGPPSPARVSDSYGPPARLSDAYGAPPRSQPYDSYGAPPRNTFTSDAGSSPSYQDSGSKPEKFVSQTRSAAASFISVPSVSAVAQVQGAPLAIAQVQSAPLAVSQVQSAPVAVQEVVRTVYQPVYVPVQYAAAAPQAEYVTLSQPATTQSVAVPTTINTGASAVAFSTIHSQPAYTIQQQQISVPVVQQVQQIATLSGDAATNTVLDDGSSSSNGGYQK